MKQILILIAISCLVTAQETCSAAGPASCSGSISELLNEEELTNIKPVPEDSELLDLSLSEEELETLKKQGQFVFPNSRFSHKNQGNNLYSLYLAYKNKIPYHFSSADQLELVLNWNLSAKQSFIESIYYDSLLEFLQVNIDHAEELKNTFKTRKYSLDQYKILFMTAKQILVNDPKEYKVPEEHATASELMLSAFNSKDVAEMVVVGKRMLVNYRNEVNHNFFSRSKRVSSVYNAIQFLGKILMNKEKDLEALWMFAFMFTEAPLRFRYTRLLEMNDYLLELEGENVSLISLGDKGRKAGIDSIKLSKADKENFKVIVEKEESSKMSLKLFETLDTYGNQIHELLINTEKMSVSMFPGKHDIFSLVLNRLIDIREAPFKAFTSSEDILYTLYNLTGLRQKLEEREQGDNEDFLEFRDGAEKFERTEALRQAIEASIEEEKAVWQSKPTLRLILAVRQYVNDNPCSDEECLSQRVHEVRTFDSFIRGSQEFLKNRAKPEGEEGELKIHFEDGKELTKMIFSYVDDVSERYRMILMELTNIFKINLEKHAYFVNYLKLNATALTSYMRINKGKTVVFSDKKQKELINFNEFHNSEGILPNFLGQVFPKNAFTNRIVASIIAQVGEQAQIGNDTLRDFVIFKHNKLALKLFKVDNFKEARLVTLKDTFELFAEQSKGFNSQKVGEYIISRSEEDPSNIHLD